MWTKYVHFVIIGLVSGELSCIWSVWCDDTIYYCTNFPSILATNIRNFQETGGLKEYQQEAEEMASTFG